MTNMFVTAAECGLEVTDLNLDAAFKGRTPRSRNYDHQNELIRRAGRAIEQSPVTMLQGLVDAAKDLCDADSAAISIERKSGPAGRHYKWVAVAGAYAPFLDLNSTHGFGTCGICLDRGPSACGICLERGCPQSFRIEPPFFDLMGVTAPPVSDGILFPWKVESLRGTVGVMAHGRTRAFDSEDCKLMLALAELIAVGVKLQREQLRQLWIYDESCGAA